MKPSHPSNNNRFNLISGSPQILLFGFFYVAWFLCVYFEKMGWGLLSLILPIIEVALMRRLSLLSKRTFAISICIFIAGYAFDSLALNLGLIAEYRAPGDGFFSSRIGIQVLPYWLISMWMLYALVSPLTVALFKNRYFVGFIMGFIFGPLSYLAGEKFQVLKFKDQYAILIYALFWGFFFMATIFAVNRKSVAINKI